MKYINKFANSIILALSLCIFLGGWVHADQPIQPNVDQAISAHPLVQNSKDRDLSVDVAVNETPGSGYFEAKLLDQCKEVGKVRFTYYRDNNSNSGYINVLHVNKDNRKQSYGSVLLQFALDTLTELNCAVIRWTASPFDLQKGQTQQTMLPKLVGFYQKHGAQVLSKNTCTAEMVYYPAKAA